VTERTSSRGVLHACKAMAAVTALSLSCAVPAGPVYQPPGANLTLGDVTHGMRAQSASSNPAAAAADLARSEGKRTSATVISGAAGLEYGNIQDLFDFYDEVTGAYEPSEPGTGGGPENLPEDKPGGIDLGDIWDDLDPDIQGIVAAFAREVVTQTAILALIRDEGYGKAWIAADAPFVFSNEYLGGAWTFGVNWSGNSKAFGLVQPIEFDEDAAREALEDWINNNLPINRPAQLPVSEDVVLKLMPVTNAVLFTITNDSSIVTKASQTTEFNLGYSRHAWSNDKGSLYLGAEARLYLKRLSRFSFRFGDVADSEELFEAIRDSNFRSDEGLGVDVGALWVSGNYQLGAQVTNVNEPTFAFPQVNLDPYSDDGVIRFLQRDKNYTMDRQLKLEASVFSPKRRWSAHLGYDVDPATGTMGDRFQWMTVSAGFSTDSRWIPSWRVGYRRNLAGSELGYASIGLTAFKIVNFDISSTFDTVRIDGTELPRGLMASIGFQIVW